MSDIQIGELHSSTGDTHSHQTSGAPGADNTCHMSHWCYCKGIMCFQTLLQTLVRLGIQMKDDYKLLEKQGLIFIKNQTAAW